MLDVGMEVEETVLKSWTRGALVGGWPAGLGLLPPVDALFMDAPYLL